MENVIFCQSCSMPMSEDSQHGKNADGSKNEDYCCYCFPNGAFSDPAQTVGEMIELCVPHMVEAGACPDAESARKTLWEQLPKLKRWKTA